MTDYLNPHRIYPDDISRRIDIAPGFDSVRPAVKESLTTAPTLSGWVRTADRLPENGDDVLVCYDDEITIGCYVGNRWYYVITRDLEYKADIWGRVKHWLPLPPLPESAGVEGTKING